MSYPLSREVIEAAFIAACHAELRALKPGNVHIHGAGHDMDVSHFERAASAAAPFIADTAYGVGGRILGAVSASMAAAGCNTNLGIVLLTAPLAVAAGAPEGPANLRERLRRVLDGLDLADADQAFRAIVLANPAGLGGAQDGDVSQPPTMTLGAAMALAADRDRIARAYVTGFDDIFSFALPELYAARRIAQNDAMAVTALHMGLLAAFPDSHIARKHGPAAAAAVQKEAQALRPLWAPVPRSETWEALLDLDRSLKARGLNPGTTADFVVATVFADRLIRPRATPGHS
ncbi:triphosphoribosyl-dephospho-CoA synthase [Hyphomicrobium nitrativorans NL23]|uniref:Triphosphoribosyl-dephospho-CoA synthase n=1 Tax=Hyphomicrobium nitrativorans NL23 TaxID=1029756 RepID=V5SF76_9HYPH|nr:triphosphoribosyl-dephospho-CoA synthase [Hyphomicrobium nitrativorans]AHB49147.1 triphosphoribosyl-dephospho-CoA synthase [Hyphomicrobium nitrativorans NL23]